MTAAEPAAPVHTRTTAIAGAGGREIGASGAGANDGSAASGAGASETGASGAGANDGSAASGAGANEIGPDGGYEVEPNGSAGPSSSDSTTLSGSHPFIPSFQTRVSSLIRSSRYMSSSWVEREHPYVSGRELHVPAFVVSFVVLLHLVSREVDDVLVIGQRGHELHLKMTSNPTPATPKRPSVLFNSKLESSHAVPAPQRPVKAALNI